MRHGASALVLPQTLGAPIACADAVPQFIAILQDRARTLGLDHLIHGHVGDMVSYRYPDGPLDLLWSEGAAYNLTFAGALSAWHPMLKTGGCAVISELTWFIKDRPQSVEAFWANACPHLADEATNVATAEANGLKVLSTERLPTEAWRRGYYAPLSARADATSTGASEAMQSVIEETRREIALCDVAEDCFG